MEFNIGGKLMIKWVIVLIYRWAINILGFARNSPCSILLAFSQFYVGHDLRKNKILVPFFYQPINFYELIVLF
jgi:hypothetical protein